MPENSRGVGPLNWRAIVDEAIRRRKAEKLTQKEHAALASVSIPTIVAFDRGERTLTLAKAFDILRVVGLTEEPDEVGAQEAFVRDAFNRWRELTSALPKNSPAHFPHGWYRFDYALEGDLKQPDLPEFERMLERAEVRHTGWPMFVTLTREELKPKYADGVIECWVASEDAGVKRIASADAAHCDFWRAAPTGRAFLIRGYQEDSLDEIPKRTIFDTTLPIWRLGEGLLHAAHLAELLKRDEESEVTVHFRALYSGLTGRTLRALRATLGDIEGRTAKGDEALLEAVVTTSKIKANLADVVYPLVSSLYERFGVASLSTDFVWTEIRRFQKNTFSDSRVRPR
jgi:transcriptional regulator with XRE-family HTH domain